MVQSCQLATDNHDKSRACVVLARASHFMRLIDHLESTNLRVFDSHGIMIPYHKLIHCGMSALLAERVSDLDTDNTGFIIQAR